LTRDGATSGIEKSITECMNDAIGNSPWTAIDAYDPDNDIAAYEAEFEAYKLILTGLDEVTDFETMFNASDLVVDNTIITAEVDAFTDILDDDLNTKILPRFRRGMQDINAVQASSFVIGEAVIEAFRTRDIAKFTADLRLRGSDQRIQATTMMLQLMAQRVSWRGDYARNYTDAMRMKFVAKKEQLDQDMDIDSKDATWDLEVFQYGANLMAGIGGGTSVPKTQGPSKVSSALGGAMGGAAAGYMIGAGIGTMSGAAVGGGMAAGGGMLFGSAGGGILAGGVASGAATGATSGSMAGPIGAVIGAVVGAAASLLM
jgi:hypothetical protein